MTSLQERFSRSHDALVALPAGEAAWFWAAAPCADGLPFFVVVGQSSDPDGARLVKRARWVAAQQAPTFTVRGVARRLQSGLLTLSTAAPLDAVSAMYDGFCRRGAMPDIALMRLDGARVVESRLVQDLSALEQAVSTLAPGEVRWFSVTDTQRPARLTLSVERSGLAGHDGVIGQLRRGRGGFQLRVSASSARMLGGAMQQWSRQVVSWPALSALAAGRIVARGNTVGVAA